MSSRGAARDERQHPAGPRADRERHRRTRRGERTTRLLTVVGILLIVGSLVALGAFAFTPSHGARHASAAPPTSAASTTPTTRVPKRPDHRSATTIENAKRGTSAWRIPPRPAWGIFGYADHVSVQRGDKVTLYVTTFASSYHIEAYRMGWYQGLGARFVWRSAPLAGMQQAEPTLSQDTRTVSTHWTPSVSLRVPQSWVPGDYLFKLVTNVGDGYIPLTVRDDTSHALVLVVNAVTTWQAYNDFGGYSLYHGPHLNPTTRSTVVSFDRPYAGDGEADFIANELGLVTLVERMGLSVTYTTDVDVHEHPELLMHHRVIVSLGHDEYWSERMREGVEAARDKGVNVMFLGANALYRRIRLEPSPLGPDRLEVNYRTTAGDRFYHQTGREPTTQWRSPPQARPESSLTGTFYECNPVNVDGVVADASSWVFAGTGLRNGDHLSLLIGTEYDRVTPGVPTPPTIEVLLHSPLRCAGRHSYSDAAYYTTSSGAGVFDAGTGAWVCKLFSGCPADVPFAPDPRVQKITENLLRVFAAGPVGRKHPAVNNTVALGIGHVFERTTGTTLPPPPEGASG